MKRVSAVKEGCLLSIVNKKVQDVSPGHLIVSLLISPVIPNQRFLYPGAGLNMCCILLEQDLRSPRLGPTLI